MLKIFREFREIDFGMLMAVYAQANQENAELLYPTEGRFVGILSVEQDFLAYLRDVFFRTKDAFYAVWVLKGVYVSALRMEPYRDGLLLEALETAPQYRKMGYASTLLRAVLQSLYEQEAVRVYSHVNKQNIASLRTHAACRFKRVSEHAAYIDGSVRDNSCTLLYSL